MKTNKRNIFLALLFAVIMCVCAAVMFIGCSKVNVTTKEPDDPTIEEPDPPHEHEFTKWASDADWHWKTCEADGVAGPKSKHKYENGVCECGRTDSRKFGTVKGKIVIKGAETPDYSDVKIDFGGDDVVVGAIGTDGTFTVTHVTVGKEYTVTATKTGYVPCSYVVRVNADGDTVDISTKPFELVKSIFDSWMSWDLDQHDFSKINDAKPMIGVYGKSLNVITHAKYDDVASSLWMRAENSTHVQSVQGIFVKFEDGKYMFLRVEQLTKDNVGTGEYKLQWAKNFNGTGVWGGNKVPSVIEEYKDFVNPLNADQKAAFEGTEGLQVTLVRKGCALYAFVDGEWIEGGTMTLPVEYADDKVQVGYWGFDGADNAQWQFKLEDNVGTYAEKIPTHTATMAEPTNGDASFDKPTYKYGDMAVITVAPDTGYILGTLTVNGKDVATSVKDGKYAFKVVENITASATFISEGQTFNTTFTVPAAANANGMKITLYRTGETDKVGTVADNKFTINDIKPGTWHAKTIVYGVEVNLKDVNVSGTAVNLDMRGVFGTETLINFGNEKVFESDTANDARYTIPANISGDAYFALKLKSPTDITGMANDAARFGLRMFYAGESEGSNVELGITLVIKSGKWRLSTCGKAYDEVDITDAYNTAIKGDGVYMAIYREGNNGKVHVYMGTDKNNLKEIAVFSSQAETSKKNIVRFGACFWKGAYNATISDVMYGTSMVKALGVQDRAVTVTGKGDVMSGGVKVGTITVPETINVYDNILVTITPAAGYKLATFTVNDSNISLGALHSVGDGSYTGTLVCYLGTQLALNATFEEYTLVDFTLNASGKKNGEATAFNNVSFTLTDVNDPNNTKSGKFTSGTILLQNLVTPATYKLAVEGYYEKEFTLANGATTATVELDYKRFDSWMDWDKDKHDMSHVNDAAPTVTLASSNASNSLNIISVDSYESVAASLWMKKDNGKTDDIQGVFLKFADDKYMFARCEKMSDGKYKIQWAKNFNGTGAWGGNPLTSVIESYNDFIKPLTTEQETAFTGTDGLKVTIVRNGYILYIFVGDGAEWVKAGTMTLPAEYATSKVKVGYWSVGIGSASSTWKFDIKSDISEYTAKINETKYTAPTVTAEHGTVAFDKNEYVYGERATVTFTPETNYMIASLTADGKAVSLASLTKKNGVYTYSFVVTSGELLNIAVTFVEYSVQDVTLTVTGHRLGENVTNLSGKITLTAADNTTHDYDLTNGRATLNDLVTNTTYKISLANYNDEQFTVEKDATTASVTLEYKRFDYWFNWAVELHDFSAVNNAEPELKFGNTDKTDQFLNVISRDSYDDVAASLWMKKENSVDSGAIQGIFLKFDDGKYMSMRCEKYDQTNGYFKLQWTKELKEGPESGQGKTGYPMAPGADWKDFQAPLSGSQYASFEQGDGLKVTVLRKGVKLYILVNDVLMPDGTMTVSDESYATKKVQVGYWTRGCKANSTRRFDIQSLKANDCSTQNVAFTVNGHKTGETSALSGQLTLTNVIDSTVTNVTLTDGNGTAEGLATPGYYKVTFGADYEGYISLAKGAATASVTLEYKRFDLWAGWDGAYHDLSKVNDGQSVIGNSGKTLNVISRDTYKDVAVSLWMKDGNSRNIQRTQGLFIKFADGKYMFIKVEQLLGNNNAQTGNYKLQWAKDFNGTGKWGDSFTNLNSVISKWQDYKNPLDDTQKSKFTSQDGDGLKVTFVRKQNRLYAYIDGVYVRDGTMILPAEYATKEAQVGFWSFDSKVNAEWKFNITKDLTGYATPEEYTTHTDPADEYTTWWDLTGDSVTFAGKFRMAETTQEGKKVGIDIHLKDSQDWNPYCFATTSGGGVVLHAPTDSTDYTLESAEKSALNNDGLYLLITVNTNSGLINMYIGTEKNAMRSVKTYTANNITTIVRNGIALKTGGDVNSSATDYAYGKSMAELGYSVAA